MRHAAAVATAALLACHAGGDQGPGPGTDPGPDPTVQAVTAGPLSQKLGEAFSDHYRLAEGMTYDQLRERYGRDYLGHLDFEVKDAARYQDFVSAFSLSSKAQQILDDRGFVVVPSPSQSGKGPADVYYQVFAADLPVFVSADSILHAWHRTFDLILEKTEEADLSQTLAALIDRTLAELADGGRAERDAQFYLAVAKSLLDGSEPPAAVKAEVDRYLQLVASRELQEVEFLGQPTWIDFSQFIPRGHYTHSEVLEKYFLAMMWLGRTDLVLHDPNPLADPRPREEAAARALAGAMQRADALPLFSKLDRFYAIFVGKTNALTPESLLALCEEARMPGCKGNTAGIEAVYAKQPPPEYSSRVFAGDVPPVTMRFFPQRFAYGAWITSQTTTPRIKPAVQGGRAMAMPEDVAFSLFGADRAVEYFAQDMTRPHRENLPATLHAARQTVADIPPSELQPTIFNHWLEGLIALSKPGLQEALPQVMRTATWHDRKLEAALASWTELRHDTILIVEQSTGGIGCQYPKGYVEPVPELYRSLRSAVALLKQVYVDGSYSLQNVAGCMDHWGSTLDTLADIAQKELASQPMSEADLAFLNQTADLHGSSYYGQRIFDGWYPQLFWTTDWQPLTGDEEPGMREFADHPSGISEPIVADVHTDAENGLALEVATSHPGMMIVAIDNQGDLSLYAGPVSSYYSFSVPLSERMTDNDWVAALDAGKLPPRPAFAQAYWAD